MCVHLLWSAGGYWPTYANWVPDFRRELFSSTSKTKGLGLKFLGYIIYNIYKDKLFWMIKETLFVKRVLPKWKSTFKKFWPQLAFSDWVVSVFLYFYQLGGFFEFFNFQIRKANSKNSGHDVCFRSLISFVSKWKSLIPVCINISLCKHQKHPKERYYPQRWSLQTFFSYEKTILPSMLEFTNFLFRWKMKSFIDFCDKMTRIWW